MSRPVFIIGAPRSGTSVLTWALGQHPNLYPLEETVWFGRFGRRARRYFELGSARGERSQLSAMGITRERFLRGLGEAIDRMILEHRSWPADPVTEDTAFALARRPDDPKERWIDGTPENSNCVDELVALFPDARFIHLLRDPASVVRSLGNFARIGGESMPADEACREWHRHVRHCLSAERSLPADTIVRLPYRELADSPAAAVRRCLEFLGEPWSDDCVKPLAHRINSSAPADPHGSIEVDAGLLAAVRDLCAALGIEAPEAMVARAGAAA